MFVFNICDSEETSGSIKISTHLFASQAQIKGKSNVET